MPSTCVYHSVTLQPGEQFNLPPGATIVGASGGLSSFDSTCPKPATLETPLCYTFLFSLNIPAGHSPNLEYNDAQTTSLRIFDVDYTVATNTAPTGAEFNAAIAAAGLTSLITLTAFLASATGERWEWQMTLSTLPSIAASMSIHITGVGFQNTADAQDGLFVYPQLVDC